MTALKKQVFPKLLIPLTGTDAQLELMLLPFNTSLVSLFSSFNRIIFDDVPVIHTYMPISTIT